MSKPPSIFISYSHKDEKVKDALLGHLGVLEKSSKPEVWSDDRIGVGDEWRPAIAQAINEATVAILLVTKDFLTSRFIQDEEVPNILNRRKTEGLIVFPVIAKDCAWQETEWLAEMNARPKNGRAFWSRQNKRDEVIAGITREVAEIIRKKGGAPKFHVCLPDTSVGTQPAALVPTLQLLYDTELILIREGPFPMGSDSGDLDAMADEKPRHSVTLPDYYLGRTPVTNRQYAEFVKNAGHVPPSHWGGGRPAPGVEDHPVVKVSFHDAIDYCRWLSGVSNVPCRLPSEAEWEKGTRGTSGNIYPWGSVWSEGLCNTKETGFKRTTPAGAYPDGKSPYGLMDMVGNVWEWTMSLWGADEGAPKFRYKYEPRDGREDLQAPADIRRVVRGGSCFYSRKFARCASRHRQLPDSCNEQIGFRIAAGPVRP